jgi:hypothetical protein
MEDEFTYAFWNQSCETADPQVHVNVPFLIDIGVMHQLHDQQDDILDNASELTFSSKEYIRQLTDIRLTEVFIHLDKDHGAVDDLY